ncbi:hypothetical protein JKA74_18805 [Marivirga sp. S37H4]|uniref:Uncharacterized protein n=1 Tax=Marivirga aurantiaca TaxID=2802615 RepID=A0A935CBZ8_9BACT|nr:hypothetical protein [Marivirga aurantiaca]MBK6267102.1 hypothetical protein [Marivirga aurantiaca]
MNKIDWSVSVVLIGVVLGWLLNQISGWTQNRKDDRKIKKLVLYNLLGVNLILNQLNNEEEIDIISTKVLLKYPAKDQTEELKESLFKFYQSFYNDFIRNIVIKKLADIKLTYSTSIEKLASIKPVIAYRLHGKTEIIETLDSIESYYGNFLEKSTESSEETEDIISFFKSNVISEVIANTISDLEREIRLIAFSVGFVTWFKIFLSFRSDKNRIRSERIKRIDQLFEKANKELFPNANK